MYVVQGLQAEVHMLKRALEAEQNQSAKTQQQLSRKISADCTRTAAVHKEMQEAKKQVQIKICEVAHAKSEVQHLKAQLQVCQCWIAA